MTRRSRSSYMLRSSSPRSLALALHGEQRDALHTVLFGRVVSTLGDEAVLIVLLEVVGLEASSLDRVSIVVALHGTADAGGPERGVAGDAGGERRARDDIGEGEPPARAEHARGLREDACLVGSEVDDAVRDHDVRANIRKWEPLDMRLHELGVREAVVGREAPRLRELRFGHVDPDHASALADLPRGKKGVHTRAAAQIDDGLAWLDPGEVEVVANAGKGVDRLGRDRVELDSRVAEPLGERAARLEVKLPERLLGDLAIHLLHAALEVAGVERRGLRAHGDLLALTRVVIACAPLATPCPTARRRRRRSPWRDRSVPGGRSWRIPTGSARGAQRRVPAPERRRRRPRPTRIAGGRRTT